MGVDIRIHESHFDDAAKIRAVSTPWLALNSDNLYFAALLFLQEVLLFDPALLDIDKEVGAKRS